MSTGQSMLVIVGLLLFSIFMLTVYRSSTARISLTLLNEATITATGIGQSLIDEIQVKAFDEKTVGTSISTPDSLTPSGSLGKDTGETLLTHFDDVDDFHNYTRTDSLSRLGAFNSKVTVSYVQKFTPEVKTTTRTFSKRIDVFVMNQALTDTIKLYHIITY